MPGAGLWALLVLILAVVQLPTILILGPIVFYVFSTSRTVTAVVFAIWSILGAKQKRSLDNSLRLSGLDMLNPLDALPIQYHPVPRLQTPSGLCHPNDHIEVIDPIAPDPMVSLVVHYEEFLLGVIHPPQKFLHVETHDVVNAGHLIIRENTAHSSGMQSYAFPVQQNVLADPPVLYFGDVVTISQLQHLGR